MSKVSCCTVCPSKSASKRSEWVGLHFGVGAGLTVSSTCCFSLTGSLFVWLCAAERVGTTLEIACCE